jgi:N5-(cytidine 5'-diphosphoramidyl)-L-glutamine hydrolase
MRMVGITQRVSVDPRHGERRDCLDQNWAGFLEACGLLPIPIPNRSVIARSVCGATRLSGIVLSGGDDLVAYGGLAPERDETESALIDVAGEQGLPVLGVCRGMQAIQHRFGVELTQVGGHVTHSHAICMNGEWVEVNSYHRWGALDSRAPLDIWAVAQDGVIEAVRHKTSRIIGLMWHPERCKPYAEADVSLFSRFFGET